LRPFFVFTHVESTEKAGMELTHTWRAHFQRNTENSSIPASQSKW